MDDLSHLEVYSPAYCGRVCVCRHEVWDRIGATIETGTLSEVSLSELGSISAMSSLLIVSCFAECGVRVFQTACDYPTVTFVLAATWFRFR